MKILITGGAGFIGSHLTNYFLRKGQEVLVFDNLSRKGVEKNLEWLKQKHENELNFIKGDIRDFNSLVKYSKDIDAIFHTAAQTAVTTSVKNPREDFEVNAIGSFNVLEAARKSSRNIIVIFTSTNKVYGDLAYVPITELGTRYDYYGVEGIDEHFQLNPCTPYGVSKAVGDVYCQDYYRTYGLKNIVFRMSCIYGEMQHGIIDQGWLDFLIRKAVRNEPITIFGTGKQVRDILHVSDLLRAFELAMDKINTTKGQFYNIGGGEQNISILEFLSMLKNQFGLKVVYSFDDWRQSDQKVFYCNINKAQKDFGWRPKIPKEDGIKRQYRWVLNDLKTTFN